LRLAADAEHHQDHDLDNNLVHRAARDTVEDGTAVVALVGTAVQRTVVVAEVADTVSNREPMVHSGQHTPAVGRQDSCSRSLLSFQEPRFVNSQKFGRLV